MPAAAAALDCLDEDTVLAFVEGTVSEAQRRRVLTHLDGCAGCQALAAELARENEGDVAPSASQLDPGGLVSGRFVLGQQLGKGAMGTVFRARDRTLGVDVALKLIRRDAAREAASAFRREVEVGRRITHPNVCRIYDAGSTEHHDYITMELVEGDALSFLLARDGVTPQRALEILGAVADGLGAAHAVGVVHRDLKPANILIEEKTGRVVITDFGLAADLETKHSRRLVGTPSFWAPEQARGEAATPACDVYALGVLAYRLFTAREFLLSDEKALDEVPRRFRKVVAKLVEPRPSNRYPDGRQAGAALAAARRRRSRLPLLLAIVAATAAVVTALGRRPPPAAPVSRPLTQIAAEPVLSPIETVTPPEPLAAAPTTSAPEVTAPSPSPLRRPAIPSAPRAAVAPAPLSSAPATSVAGASSATPATTDGDLLYRR